MATPAVTTRTTRMRAGPRHGPTKVPPGGDDRRAWIRHELQRRVNATTGRRYTQADIAREAQVNESTVSLVYTGTRKNGLGTQRVMRVTARILGMDTNELFGVPLTAGDGYTPGASAATDGGR